MGKRQVFTIADEDFIHFLSRIDNSFKEEGINYALVGGVANQAYIAKSLCARHNADLATLAFDSDVRLQDHLRATDDVDMILSMNSPDEIATAHRIYGVLDKIVGEGEFISPTGNHIVYVNLKRKGHSKPQFILGVDNPDQYRLVALNLNRNPRKNIHDPALVEFETAYFNEFMGSKQEVEIPYTPSFNAKLSVISPAALLATKIARKRPKDIMDAYTLVNHFKESGMQVPYDEVEKLLKGRGELLFQRYERFRDMEESS